MSSTTATAEDAADDEATDMVDDAAEEATDETATDDIAMLDDTPVPGVDDVFLPELLLLPPHAVSITAMPINVYLLKLRKYI